jgi:hypothetical protein
LNSTFIQSNTYQKNLVQTTITQKNLMRDTLYQILLEPKCIISKEKWWDSLISGSTCSSHFTKLKFGLKQRLMIFTSQDSNGIMNKRVMIYSNLLQSLLVFGLNTNMPTHWQFLSKPDYMIKIPNWLLYILHIKVT